MVIYLIPIAFYQIVVGLSTYPLVIGNNAGATVIQKFQYDSSGNLVIHATTNDMSLIQTSSTCNSYCQITLYLAAGQTSYKWKKEIVFDQSLTSNEKTLMSMDVDNSQILLLFYCPVLIILNQSDGSVKRYIRFNDGTTTGSQIICTLGCFAQFHTYSSSKVTMFAEYQYSATTSSAMYVNFNYQTTSYSGISINVMTYFLSYIDNDDLTFSTNNFIVALVNDSRFVVINKNTGDIIEKTKALDVSVQLESIGLYEYPSTTNVSSGVVYGCYGETDLFGYTTLKISNDSASNPSDLNQRTISKTCSDCYCKGIKSVNGVELYAILFMTTTGNIKLYVLTLQVGSNQYTAKYLSDSSVTVRLGFIRDSQHFYISSNNVWDFLTDITKTFSSSYDISYILQLDSTDTYITVPAMTSQSSLTSTTVTISSFEQTYPTTTSASAIIDFVDSNCCTLNVVNYQTTIYSVNLTPAITFEYFAIPLGTSTTFTISATPVIPSPGVPSISITPLTTVDSSISVSTPASPYTTYTVTSSTILASLLTVTYQYRLEIILMGANQNCLFYENLFEIGFYEPTITGHSLTNINYDLYSSTEYSYETVFTPNPTNFTTYSIIYKLKDSSGTFLSATNSYLSYSYNTTHITFSVYSTSITTGTYTFYLVALFSGGYHSSYSIQQQITLTITNVCATDTMTASSIASPQYYLIGNSAQSVVFPQFSTLHSCNTIIYQLTQTSPSMSQGTYTSPPISFDGTNRQISIYVTSDYTLSKVYSVQIKGQYQNIPAVSDTSSVFDFYVIAPIIAGVVPISTIYYVSDTAVVLIFTPFQQQSTISGVTFSLYLEEPDGTPYNNTPLFTLNQATSTITIYTLDNSLKAAYSLRIRASFNSITLVNSDVYSNEFTIEVKDQCYLNKITSSSIPTLYYNVTDSQLMYQYSQWTLTKQVCNPFSYTITYNAGSLPSFIVADTSLRMFKISSDDPAIVGNYNIKVTGETYLYNVTSSIIATTFQIVIGCTAKKLDPLSKDYTRYFFIGVSFLQLISISEYIIWPECIPSTPIKFESYLQDDEELPHFIGFDGVEKRFIVIDTGDLVAQVYIIQVIATTDTGLQSIYYWSLQLIPYQTKKRDLVELNLPEISIKLLVNSQLLFRSDDFAKYTTQGYGLINKDMLDFITLLGQQVKIKPLQQNIGHHSFQLIGISNDNTQKLLQKVNILVQSEPEEQVVNQGGLKVKIKEIDRNGNVTIQFSEPISKQVNYTDFNETILELAILDYQYQKRNIKFNWTVNLIRNDIMKINITFEDPLEVSQNVNGIIIIFIGL